MRTDPATAKRIRTAASRTRGVRLEAIGGQVGGVKRPKYGNKRVTVGGVTWDSQRELDRWAVLFALWKRNAIRNLRRQVRFDLHARGGVKVSAYVADFVYESGGALVVEDAKGFRTALYKLKRKWLEAEYGLEIREV